MPIIYKAIKSIFFLSKKTVYSRDRPELCNRGVLMGRRMGLDLFIEFRHNKIIFVVQNNVTQTCFDKIQLCELY